VNKVIYLIRHSETEKNIKGIDKNNPNENKKIKLTHKGLLDAKKYFKNEIFKNIEKVYCSDYVRSYETGKLLKDEIIIDSRFCERISGKPDFLYTPNYYFYKQIMDENYKFENGESRKEITNRMYEGLMDILNDTQTKEVAIISHGVAMTFLIMKFCELEIVDTENKIRRIKFNDKVIFNDKFNYLETFKLVFNKKNEIVEIKNERIDYNV